MTPISPSTPIARFYARRLPASLVPIAMVLTYAFFLVAIGLTIGTPPPDLMYIDVRDQ